MKTSRQSGFTLIELMIAVAIVGIIAAVAFPTYNNQIRKSRRADAVNMIAAVQQAQERWRANKPSYATQAELTGAAPAGLAMSTASTNGYYTFSVSGVTANAYSIKATAVAGKSQVKDTGCSILDLVVTNGTPVYTQPTCWSK